MKLSQRVLAPVALAAVTLGIVLAYVITVERQGAEAQARASDARKLVVTASELRGLNRAIERDVIKIIYSPLSAAAQGGREDIRTLSGELLQKAKTVAAVFSTGEVAALPALQEKLLEAVAAVDHASQELGRDGSLKLFRDDLEPVTRQSSGLIDRVVSAASQEADSIEIAARAATERALHTLVWTSLVVLAGLIGTSLFTVIKGVVRPMHALCSAIDAMSAGKYERATPGTKRGDELGQIARAVEMFRESLICARDDALDRERMRSIARHEREANDQAKTERAEQAANAVAAIGAALVKLATGDLTARVDSDLAADFARLKEDLNASVLQLQAALRAIADSGRSIRDGSDEVARAMGDLARRTEQQATNLQQAATSLREITGTVRSTADRTRIVNEVAHTAEAEAGGSTEMVAQAVAAMDSIESSAGQISNITDVIEAIAFQTSLLALNASVEAARAGEAGKGFAVVAMEVRTLSQDTAESAKQIKSYIANSNQKIAIGAQRVRQMGDVIRQILGKISETNRLISEIASTTQHQSSSLDALNETVNSLDRLTQHNAAMVQESATAVTQLAHEVDEMHERLSAFTLDAAPQAGRRAA